jgi:archaellum component FlaC
MFELDVKTIRAKIKDLYMCQEVLKSTLDTFEKTVVEVSNSIVEEARRQVFEFFDPASSPLVKEILDFIENYRPSINGEVEDFKTVFRRLHEFYLKLKEDIAQLIANKANGRIFEFAKDQERFVSERLAKTFETFMSVFRVALESYRGSLLEKMGVELKTSPLETTDFWVPSKELFPPSFTGFVQQQGLGRGALLMKFGLGKVIEKLAKLRDALGRKRSRKSHRHSTQSEAIDLVKNEIRAEMEEAFEWYGEKYVEEYLTPLIDNGISWLIREIRLRAESSVIDFHSVVATIDREGASIDNKKKILQDAIDRLSDLSVEKL